jgi:hypothetical protein
MHPWHHDLLNLRVSPVISLLRLPSHVLHPPHPWIFHIVIVPVISSIYESRPSLHDWTCRFFKFMHHRTLERPISDHRRIPAPPKPQISALTFAPPPMSFKQWSAPAHPWAPYIASPPNSCTTNTSNFPVDIRPSAHELQSMISNHRHTHKYP